MTLELLNQFKFELTFIGASVCSLLTSFLLCGSSNKKQQASNTSLLKGSSVMERPSGEATQTLTPSLANKPLKVIKKPNMSPDVCPRKQDKASLKSKSLPSFPEPVIPEFLLRQPCPDPRSGFSDFSNPQIDKARAKEVAVVKQSDGRAPRAQISREKGIKAEQKRANEDRDFPVKPAVIKRGPTILNAKISKHTLNQLEKMLTSLDDMPKTNSTVNSSLKLAALENVDVGNFNKQDRRREENKENFEDKIKEGIIKDDCIGKDEGKRKYEFMENKAGNREDDMVKFGVKRADERMLEQFGNKRKDADEIGKNVGMEKYGRKGKKEVEKEVGRKNIGGMGNDEIKRGDGKAKVEFIRKDDCMRKHAYKGKYEYMEKFTGEGRDERMGKIESKEKLEEIGKHARMGKNEVMGKNEDMNKNEVIGEDLCIGRNKQKKKDDDIGKDEGMGKKIAVARYGGKGKEEGMGKHVGMGRYGGRESDENIRKKECLRENEGIEREENRKNEPMRKNQGMRKDEDMPKKGSKVKIQGNRFMGKQEYQDKR